MLTQHPPKSCFEKISQERRLWPPSQADVVFRFRNSAIQQSLPKGGWNSPAPMGHPRAHHLGEDASAQCSYAAFGSGIGVRFLGSKSLHPLFLSIGLDQPPRLATIRGRVERSRFYRPSPRISRPPLTVCAARSALALPKARERTMMVRPRSQRLLSRHDGADHAHIRAKSTEPRQRKGGEENGKRTAVAARRVAPRVSSDADNPRVRGYGARRIFRREHSGVRASLCRRGSVRRWRLPASRDRKSTRLNS